RLPFLTHLLGLGCVLVEMMGDGTKVVKELAVNRPAVEFIREPLPNEACPFGFNGILQSELLAIQNDVTQALIRNPTLIHGHCRRGKPPLVDAASVCAICVEIFCC